MSIFSVKVKMEDIYNERVDFRIKYGFFSEKEGGKFIIADGYDICGGYKDICEAERQRKGHAIYNAFDST